MSDQESRRFVVIAVGLCMTFWCAAAAGGEQTGDSDSKQHAQRVLRRLGVERGVCVLLDQSPAEMAIALARQSKLTVYAQVPDEDSAENARRRIDRAGMLGTRVYVEKGCWSRVHLADNLADAVVVTPRAVSAAEPYREELMRVVNPLGTVLLGDELITKPYPPEADDWSHPFHRLDNNPQSADQLARGPYLTQFMSEPWYVPMPGVTVARLRY